MFIGHFGAAMAAKRIAPKLNFAWSILACQWLDLIWPIFVMAGVEKVSTRHVHEGALSLDFAHYPYTHSLLAAVFWSCLLGGVFYLFKRDKRSALVLGLLVVSHWVLDFVVHEPDLPLGLGDAPKLGLGLWHSVPLTLLVEFLIFFIGVALFLKAKSGGTRMRPWAFFLLALFLIVIQLMSSLGPPPPIDASPMLLAGPAFLLWLLIPWAAAIDKS